MRHLDHVYLRSSGGLWPKIPRQAAFCFAGLPRSEIRLFRQTTGGDLGSCAERTSANRSKTVHTLQQLPSTHMASWRADIGTGGKMNERLEVNLRTLKAVLAMWNIRMKLFAHGSTPLDTPEQGDKERTKRQAGTGLIVLILFLLGSQNRHSCR